MGKPDAPVARLRRYHLTIAALQYWQLIAQVIGAILASLSAGAWGYASYLGLRQGPAGYDKDVAAAKAAQRQSMWNGYGAMFAAVSAAAQTVAIALGAGISAMS